jgi:transposase-like protein
MKGQHTGNEMAATFGVHPHQVVQWKKQALEALPDACSRRRVREAHGDEA